MKGNIIIRRILTIAVRTVPPGNSAYGPQKRYLAYGLLIFPFVSEIRPLRPSILHPGLNILVGVSEICQASGGCNVAYLYPILLPADRFEECMFWGCAVEQEKNGHKKPDQCPDGFKKSPDSFHSDKKPPGVFRIQLNTFGMHFDFSFNFAQVSRWISEPASYSERGPAASPWRNKCLPTGWWFEIRGCQGSCFPVCFSLSYSLTLHRSRVVCSHSRVEVNLLPLQTLRKARLMYRYRFVHMSVCVFVSFLPVSGRMKKRRKNTPFGSFNVLASTQKPLKNADPHGEKCVRFDAIEDLALALDRHSNTRGRI